jgi:hypothetical protein
MNTLEVTILRKDELDNYVALMYMSFPAGEVPRIGDSLCITLNDIETAYIVTKKEYVISQTSLQDIRLFLHPELPIPITKTKQHRRYNKIKDLGRGFNLGRGRFLK